MANRAVDRLYPEIAAGGFTRFDHQVGFFSRVNALASDTGTVIDLGAGRAAWADHPETYTYGLRHLRGRVGRLIGLDVDDAVMENPAVDEARMITPGTRWPVDDESADLILSYAVLEHVDDPTELVTEVTRTLKPGGWFCAWTPTKWGYVGLGARLVPNRFHVGVLKRIGMVEGERGRRAHDVFPTRYRMNTLSAIRRYFPSDRFRNCSYVYSGPEGYAGRSVLLAYALRFYNWIMPAPFGTHLYVFVQKK